MVWQALAAVQCYLRILHIYILSYVQLPLPGGIWKGVWVQGEIRLVVDREHTLEQYK